MLKKLFILFLYLPVLGFCQSYNYRFNQISVNNGLSNSHAKTTFQDYLGFIWIGTTNGLNRYDGYSCKVFKHVLNDSSSLPDNEIFRIFEDSDKNLWICTATGLCRYDRNTNSFINHSEIIKRPARVINFAEGKDKTLYTSANTTVYAKSKNDKRFRYLFEFLNDDDDEITAMYLDTRGICWMVTRKNFIYNYNTKLKRLTERKDIPVKDITWILEDRHHNILFSTFTGIYCYSTKDNKLVPFLKKSELNALITHFCEDAYGRILAGTVNKGLYIIDPTRTNVYHYTYQTGDPESLSSNSVNNIYIDRNKNLWLGTYAGGVNLLTERNFDIYRSNLTSQNSLSNNNIASLCEDNQGNIWIGTDGGGLNKFNPKTKNFTRFQTLPGNPNTISTNVVTSILIDKKGIMWLGYWDGGFDQYNPVTNKFTHYRKSDKNGPGKDLLDPNVMYLFEDKQGNIWVETLTGLMLFDQKANRLIHYPAWGHGPEVYITDMLDARDGNLYLASFFGLQILDRKSKKRINFKHNDKDPRSICNDKLYTVTEDRKGRIWIGTGGGLSLFDKKSKKFSNIYAKDGLPSDIIYGIYEDKKGNLWLSTNNGICSYNPETKKIRIYDISDGIQGNEFKLNAHLKLKNGDFVFGGINGFTIFNPDKIRENKNPPPVVFTDFQIFNSSVNPSDPQSPLKTDISVTKEITLNYDQSVFTIEFSALNYISQQKNHYAYILEPFEKNWNKASKNRRATYTNLDPGEYTFRVRASNNDGVWNMAGNSIKIIVTPPFWLTWWFRTALVLIIVGSAYSYYLYRINDIKRQKVVLEDQIEKRTHEVRQQAEELKAQAEQLQGQAKTLQEVNHVLEQQKVEAQQARAEINQTLKEKKLLIKETHHRVKNNFQIISSLLELQTKGIEDKKALALVQNGKNRIKSMALIHQKLYENNDGLIDFEEYISLLVDEIASMYDTDKRILIAIHAKNLFLDIDTAIPLGLIINELVTNTYKYAFPENQTGKLDIIINRIDGGSYQLTISDNGSGFANNFDIKNAKSFGLRLVTRLVRQLQGTLSFTNNNGTTFEIIFKDLQARKDID